MEFGQSVYAKFTNASSTTQRCLVGAGLYVVGAGVFTVTSCYADAKLSLTLYRNKEKENNQEDKYWFYSHKINTEWDAVMMGALTNIDSHFMDFMAFPFMFLFTAANKNIARVISAMVLYMNTHLDTDN